MNSLVKGEEAAVGFHNLSLRKGTQFSWPDGEQYPLVWKEQNLTVSPSHHPKKAVYEPHRAPHLLWVCPFLGATDKSTMEEGWGGATVGKCRNRGGDKLSRKTGQHFPKLWRDVFENSEGMKMFFLQKFIYSLEFEQRNGKNTRKHERFWMPNVFSADSNEEGVKVLKMKCSEIHWIAAWGKAGSETFSCSFLAGVLPSVPLAVWLGHSAKTWWGLAEELKPEPCLAIAPCFLADFSRF